MQARWFFMAVLAGIGSDSVEAQSSFASRAEVMLRQVADQPPPIGVNDFGDPGGTRYSAGNLIPDWGFEPGMIRQRYRVLAAGEEGGYPWVELDGPGLTRFDLVTSGFLSGSDYRIYRLVDASGDPLPPEGDYLNIGLAARYTFVTNGVVPPAGSPGLPYGGWVAQAYAQSSPLAGTRTTNFIDAAWVDNDETYYYLVTALNDSGALWYNTRESERASSPEVAVTPSASISNAPVIWVLEGDPINQIRTASAGQWYSFRPRVAGAEGTVTWALLDEHGQPVSPPDGMTFDPSSGELGGAPVATPPPTLFRWQATAANGIATRDFILNQPGWTATGSSDDPLPPTHLVATPGNGYVTLSWNPSPSPGVIGYRIYRSTVPLTQQVNRVYLPQGTPVPLRWDYIHFDLKTTDPDPAWSHPRVRSGAVRSSWRDWQNSIHVSRVPHPGVLPPGMEHAGETCMRAQPPDGGIYDLNGPVIFYPRRANDGEALWYGALEPGQTYRYEAWMRQEGLGNGGEVRMSFINMYADIATNVTVTGDWQLHGFEFTAPAIPTNGGHASPSFRFAGPGALYVDSVRLFRFDDPVQLTGPTPPSPKVFDPLMASQPSTGPKGILRDMYVLMNRTDMAGNLSWQRTVPLDFDWYQQFGRIDHMTLPAFLNYALATGATPAERMKPWVCVSSWSTEEEWRMLIEYLAASIDPDDPSDVAAKPWAHLRYRQRGVTTPWTEEFPHLFIEFANETWHNSVVNDHWFGWGRHFFVNDGGREFGLYARHVFDTLLAASPELPALLAGGKLRFVMGSSYFDYAESGISYATNTAAIGHTTYVGPRWEVGEPPNEVFNDEGVQSTLLGYVENLREDVSRWRVAREQLLAQGISYELLAYEGGPSGYSIPGTAPEPSVEIGEQYGKSLAMGVAALDAWLAAYEAGFTEQGFLSFSSGRYWSSHTTPDQEFRPHAGWLALVLRNLHGRGHMIAVEQPVAPVILRNGTPFPLVGTYAFRDGARIAVFLLSRSLDETIPVTLSLPGTPTGPASLYRLEADPRANNRTAMEVDIQESTVTLDAETEIQLPPGAIYVYVVDTDLDDASVPPPRVENPSVAYFPGGADLAWDVVPGVTGYVVYRSLFPHFDRVRESARIEVSGNIWTDPDAVGGSEFYYRIAAVNEWGAGLASPVAFGGANTNAPPYPAPALLGAGLGDGRLILSWDFVAGATNYRVGYGTQDGGPYTWVEAGNTNRWLITGLVNGLPVYWTVQAEGPAGRGLIALNSAATPLPGGSLQAIASWDFTAYSSYESTAPVSARLMVVDVDPVTRGPGLAVGDLGYHPITNSFAFIPAADSGNFGASGGGSLADAIDRDMYLAFTITPDGGHALSFDRIEAGGDYRYGSRVILYALRYRVGDGPWFDAASGPFAVTGGVYQATPFTFDVSGETALQEVTGAVEFRVYVYSLATDARWCRGALGRRDGGGMTVLGTYRMTELGRYRAWAETVFSAEEISGGDAEPLADAGGGVINWLHYLFGGQPGTAASDWRPLSLIVTQGVPVLAFPVREHVSPHTWRLETTTNLLDASSWVRDEERLPVHIHHITNGIMRMTAEDGDPVGDHVYYRLIGVAP